MKLLLLVFVTTAIIIVGIVIPAISEVLSILSSHVSIVGVLMLISLVRCRGRKRWLKIFDRRLGNSIERIVVGLFGGVVLLNLSNNLFLQIFLGKIQASRNAYRPDLRINETLWKFLLVLLLWHAIAIVLTVKALWLVVLLIAHDFI